MEEGDLVGICYNFSPPDRYPNIEDLWAGSKIIIFKNGRPIASWDKINQCFYCPAISLYNFARVEFRVKREQIDNLPEGYTPYFDIYNEEIIYENLRQTALFNPMYI